MQVYVQKSTSTTLPRRSDAANRDELSHSAARLIALNWPGSRSAASDVPTYSEAIVIVPALRKRRRSASTSWAIRAFLEVYLRHSGTCQWLVPRRRRDEAQPHGPIPPS